MSNKYHAVSRQKTTRESITRRRLLASVGLGGAGLIAGCSSGDNNGDGSGPPGGDDSTNSPGGDSGAYTPWPVSGRVPGWTQATPDTAPDSLNELASPVSDVRSPPLITTEGVVAESEDTVQLVPMTGGEPVWSRTIRPVDNLAVLNETVVARTNEGVVGLGLSSGETTTEFGLNLSEDDTTFPADGGLGYRRDTLSDTAGSGGSELGVRDIGGSVRWENRVEAGFGSRRYRDPIASPAEGIVTVGDFYYGKRTSPRPDREHFLRAYDLADGTEQWSIEGIIRPRSVGNGRVIAERYEAGSQTLSKSETLALDTESGDVLWSRTDLPNSDSGFIEDPIARTADGGDLIYFSGSDQLHALEPEDGSTRWTYDAFPESNGGGAANIAAATEAVVVSTAAGIAILSPTDGTRRASKSLSSFSEFVAVAGGRMYAAGRDLGLTVLGES